MGLLGNVRLIQLILAGGALLLQPACRSLPRDDSEPKVIGGREDLEYQLLPKTVGIDVNGGLCTGVFISDRLLLTAAHCVGNQPFKVVSKLEPFASKPPVSTKIIMHPEYPKDALGYGKYYTDVAVGIYPPGTAPENMIAKLATVPPKAGDPVRFVGYGQYVYKGENGGGAGVRRYGENKVAWVDGSNKSIFKIEGIPVAKGAPGEELDAATAPGDSGGPLYNEAEEVIGTVSNGVINKNGRKETFFANVTAPETRGFIDQQLKEHGGAPAAPRSSPRNIPNPTPPPPPTPPPTDSRTQKPADQAPSGDSAYFPRCKRDGYNKAGVFALRFIDSGDVWGYMKKESGEGFSCKEKGPGGDEYLPVCAQVCGGATLSGGYGWCTNVDGFSCKK